MLEFMDIYKQNEVLDLIKSLNWFVDNNVMKSNTITDYRNECFISRITFEFTEDYNYKFKPKYKGMLIEVIEFHDKFIIAKSYLIK